MDINYESIEPLIERAEQEGPVMVCEFRCPSTDASVESTAPIRHRAGLLEDMKLRAKRDLVWRLKSAAARAARRVLGHDLAGRLGSNVVGSITDESAQTTDDLYTEEERRSAVVEAFRRVRSRFVRDREDGAWRCRKEGALPASDFQKQVDRATVDRDYDRRILSRMLVEISAADGHFDAEERAFVRTFLPPDIGTVDELHAMSELTRVELEETSLGPARETMLMLAWTVAMTDRELHPNEQARLDFYRESLGIPESRADFLRRWAVAYVVETMLDELYQDGSPDDEEFERIVGVAASMGLPREEVERAAARYREHQP